ncbi:MAG: hypothetical protein K6B44_05040 [Lachnospiraceae bacterium]|nr:hypothetical protein [Lachnospiraceae bacterium]
MEKKKTEEIIAGKPWGSGGGQWKRPGAERCRSFFGNFVKSACIWEITVILLLSL